MRKLFNDVVSTLLVVAIVTAVIMPIRALAQAPNGGQATPITTATFTPVRNGFGYLNLVSINGGTAGTVTLYDVASSGCTATPASGKFATIAAATAPVTLFYETSVKQGLCVVTAAATDVTISWN